MKLWKFLVPADAGFIVQHTMANGDQQELVFENILALVVAADAATAKDLVRRRSREVMSNDDSPDDPKWAVWVDHVEPIEIPLDAPGVVGFAW